MASKQFARRGGIRWRAACARCARLWICSLVLGHGRPALALNPDLRLTQYGHTAWTVRDGSLPAAPTSITQTSDGFLWIATEAGLQRFDGARFERWRPPDGAKLPSDRIYSVLGTKDGGLWIGTAAGLARWKGGKLDVFETQGHFGSLIEDRRGDVWAGHTRVVPGVPGLCRFTDGTFRCLENIDALTFRTVAALNEDRNGEIWIGAMDKVCRWRSGDPECFSVPGVTRGLNVDGVVAMTSDAQRNVWVSTLPSGISRLSSGRWAEGLAPSRLEWSSQAMRVDRRDALWVGTIGGGLARYMNARSERITRSDGLSGDGITDIFEDREGNVWVGTSAGLDRFRDVKIITLTEREGLPSSEVIAVATCRRGGVWVAGGTKLSRLDNDSFSAPWTVGHEFPGKYLTSLFEDSHGRLWIGVDDTLAWLENGRFGRLQIAPAETLRAVLAMAEDKDGSLWLATANPDRALVRVRGNRVVEALPKSRFGGEPFGAIVGDPAGGVWVGTSSTTLWLYNNGHIESFGRVGSMRIAVRALFLDSGDVWEVTSAGLRRFRNGKFDTLDSKNGLPCDDIESAQRDDDGSLWLKTACGLVQVGAQALAAWSKDPGSQIPVRILDAFDGAQAGLTAFTPRAARSPDGRFWFAINDGGLQEFNPRHVDHNSTPPPVQVVRLFADHQPHEPTGAIELPPHTHDLEIDYVALSLTIPERVRFRYRLEGADGDWQDVGTRREAFFTNLKPGGYTFRVVACNSDGVWNTEGAAAAFTILPAFYQTRSFFVSCVLLSVGLLWGGVRFRVHQVRASLDQRYEERLAERTRIARELHDTLLQGFISASMQLHLAADQLPAESADSGRLTRVLDLMGRVIEDGRNAVRGLRAPDVGVDNLEAAFSRAARELGVEENVRIHVIGEGRERPLRPGTRDEIFSIGREALANAIHHARARSIEVEVEFTARALRLIVRDDGVGIDPSVVQSGREGHWGFAGMHERAEKIGGRIRVLSRSGAGTEVELTVPGRMAFSSGRLSRWAGWLRARLVPVRDGRE